MDDFNGLLVIDKPPGITSRAVVNRAQTWFPRGTRIGHTGTLDPLATGVLVLCVGAATRLTEYVQQMPKVYSATILLGATSDTDDADGVITPTPDAPAPSREMLGHALTGFVGTFDQVPPAYSAAKVTGRRAYDLARKGKEFELAPRKITIHQIDVTNFEFPRLEIVVRCGKGTYIRSLARDLGERLGCGGHITVLRRLEVGGFTVVEALSLDVDAITARQQLLPIERAVQNLPRITLSNSDAAKLVCGQSVAAPVDPNGPAAVFKAAGRFLAIAEIVEGQLKPSKVFAGKATI